MLDKLVKAIIAKDDFAISVIYTRMLNSGFTDNMIISELRSKGYLKDDR